MRVGRQLLLTLCSTDAGLTVDFSQMALKSHAAASQPATCLTENYQMDRMAGSAGSRRQITAGRWQKLKAVLADALEETSSSRRAELLRQACASDPDLLPDAEALLSGDTASLEQFAEWATTHLREDLPDRVGERVGAYHIIK